MQGENLSLQAGGIKKKQEEMLRQLTVFFDDLYTLSEEQRCLMKNWKGEAGKMFDHSFQTEWEKVFQFGKELRKLIGMFAEAENRFADCEGKIAELLCR